MYTVQMPNLICGKTFTPHNDKVHIRLPISMIATSQTCARVYICDVLTRYQTNLAAIGHLIGACQLEEMVNCCHKSRSSRYWAAQIETLCMMLYIC